MTHSPDSFYYHLATAACCDFAFLITGALTFSRLLLVLAKRWKSQRGGERDKVERARLWSTPTAPKLDSLTKWPKILHWTPVHLGLFPDGFPGCLKEWEKGNSGNLTPGGTRKTRVVITSITDFESTIRAVGLTTHSFSHLEKYQSISPPVVSWKWGRSTCWLIVPRHHVERSR